MQKTYLIYVTGKDRAGKSKMATMILELSGADIQRKKHIQMATAAAKEKGLEVVNDVFFADSVHAAVEEGMELQGDTSSICAQLHNELRKGGEVQPPPQVNEAMWRIADSFLQFQAGAIPERSKIQFLKSLGSNQPSWDRAVYGVFRVGEDGKRGVSKLAVDDLSELKSLEKAGINMELMLRVLSKMGVLEPVLRLVERRVSALVKLRQKMGLDKMDNAAVEVPEPVKISTKKSANETRNPF